MKHTRGTLLGMLRTNDPYSKSSLTPTVPLIEPSSPRSTRYPCINAPRRHQYTKRCNTKTLQCTTALTTLPFNHRNSDILLTMRVPCRIKSDGILPEEKIWVGIGSLSSMNLEWILSLQQPYGHLVHERLQDSGSQWLSRRIPLSNPGTRWYTTSELNRKMNFAAELTRTSFLPPLPDSGLASTIHHISNARHVEVDDTDIATDMAQDERFLCPTTLAGFNDDKHKTTGIPNALPPPSSPLRFLQPYDYQPVGDE